MRRGDAPTRTSHDALTQTTASRGSIACRTNAALSKHSWRSKRNMATAARRIAPGAAPEQPPRGKSAQGSSKDHVSVDRSMAPQFSGDGWMGRGPRSVRSAPERDLLDAVSKTSQRWSDAPAQPPSDHKRARVAQQRGRPVPMTVPEATVHRSIYNCPPFVMNVDHIMIQIQNNHPFFY
jgi:hypothetical protein